jgi:hypothetical protein
MKIPALASMWMCAVFALVSCAIAYDGFTAAATIADAAERDLSLGYAGFWAFLGVVAAAFGVLSWMIKEGRLGDIR